MTSELTAHWVLPEPFLSFHPERTSERDIHPLRGLVNYGPYSRGIVPDPIRVATIAPSSDKRRLYSFLKDLNAEALPTEREDYLPAWPGFTRIFGVRMASADRQSHVELSDSIDEEFERADKPHLVLAERLTRTIQGLEGVRTQFDVLFLYLPQRWAPYFKAAEEEDFDLHDFIKAFAASRAIPLQIVREDKALSYPDKASVMWRIGLALYAKAGGIPWKLADMDSETAYIGLSYALRPQHHEGARFVTCCSQVFDAEGSGLQFVAYDAHEVEVRRENPFLSRTEMFRVMARSMDLYRRQHAGRSPRRVMVHKTSEFKPDEIDGCMDAFNVCESVDLIQVVEDVTWRGALIASKATPANFPVPRGTLVQIGEREALLWTHGDVKNIRARGSYFQGGKGTPRPLKLVRYAGHGAWDNSAQAVLALTKMDWNNDALYSSLPVTLGYAKVLARVLKRMQLGPTPYQFRYFM